MHAVKMLNFIFGIVYCRVGQRGIMKSIIHHIYHFITGLVDHIVWIHGIVVRFHKLRHFFVLFCYKNLRKKQTNKQHTVLNIKRKNEILVFAWNHSGK